MKLAHLLIMVFTTAGLLLPVAWLLSLAGMSVTCGAMFWLSAPIAFFAALPLAWPISRLFRLSPLMIFAGPCPGCRTRPAGWWGTQSGRKTLLLVCGACGERVELWLTRRPSLDLVPASARIFRLRWPEFLGIWQEVQHRNDSGTAGSV